MIVAATSFPKNENSASQQNHNSGLPKNQSTKLTCTPVEICFKVTL